MGCSGCLSTPAVLVGRLAFSFSRGWRSLVSRRLNMFHADRARHRRRLRLEPVAALMPGFSRPTVPHARKARSRSISSRRRSSSTLFLLVRSSSCAPATQTGTAIRAPVWISRYPCPPGADADGSAADILARRGPARKSPDVSFPLEVAVDGGVLEGKSAATSR